MVAFFGAVSLFTLQLQIQHLTRCVACGARGEPVALVEKHPIVIIGKFGFVLPKLA
jgi:hypothetical protein